MNKFRSNDLIEKEKSIESETISRYKNNNIDKKENDIRVTEKDKCKYNSTR